MDEKEFTYSNAVIYEPGSDLCLLVAKVTLSLDWGNARYWK